MYVDVAKKHDLDPAQMALAYVNSRSFLIANIIGATTVDQLKTDINSIDIKLNDDIVTDIEAIHKTIPNPSP